jgi:hypothetical protein
LKTGAILFFAVMMGVQLACLGGVMMGVRTVSCGAMGVMRSGLRIVFLIMLGGQAMVLRGLFVMLGGVVMMFAGGVLVRHALSPGFGIAP